MSKEGVGGGERLARVLRVASQRKDVGDPFPLHPVENLASPIGGVRAREMGHRRNVIVALDPRHKLERLLSGTQPVGDRNPVRRMTGEKTLELVTRIKRHYHIEAMAHLTCA